MSAGNVSAGQIFAALFIVPVIYYLCFKWQPRYFKKMGVQGPFAWPVVGNMMTMIKKGFMEADAAWSKEYGRVVGIFEGPTPVLYISDPDLVQQILIKDFHIFSNRRALFAGDDIVDNFLITLNGDHWRHVRHLLAPTFSTGKLKKMTSDVNDCAKLLVDNLLKMAANGKAIDMKDRCGQFTMDVIARTSFGIEIDTMKNPNSPFVFHAKRLFENGLTRLAFVVFIFLPFLRPVLRKLHLSLLDETSLQFFKNVVVKAINERKQEQLQRTDFLQLMLNAHNDKEVTDNESIGSNGAEHSFSSDKKGLTENEILAQAILFLLAGYETTASTLAFVTHCLALNPDCQEKLYTEIESVIGNTTEIDFDLINKLTYMDQCIKETQRLYPIISRTDRQAVKDTSIAGIPIPKGMTVGIQIYTIQHDPLLWPDPYKYDPERFSAESVANHHPMQFLPFSLGPRMCIGMRLALLDMKVALVHLVKTFRFVRCSETEVPIQFKKMGLLQAKNGVKLKLELRN